MELYSFYMYTIESVILSLAFFGLLVLLVLTRHINASVHKNIKLLIVDFGLVYLFYILFRLASIILTFNGILVQNNTYASVVDRIRVLLSIASSLDFAMVVVERTIATIYSKTYENVAHSGYIFAVLIIVQVYSLLA